MRTKAEIIHQAKRWERRRLNIIKHIWSREPWKPSGYFSKNKVHCSCPSCQRWAKTNSMMVKKNWKHSDKKKLLKGLDLDAE